MLQEKDNKNCFRLILIIFVWLSVFIAFPFAIILLLFYLYKSDFNLNKSLKKYWLLKCYYLEKSLKTFKAAYEENKKNYEILKNDETWLDIEKKTEFKEDAYTIIDNDIKFVDSEIYNSNIANTKNTSTNKYEFNSWKSIWDDYESVIDKK